MGDDPQPGEVREFLFDHGNGTITIERTEWYQRVLSATRSEEYRFLELALPRSDRELAQEWDKAVYHLQNAEGSYASGDDAATFSHLRGALDALPGAKQAICDSIADVGKRRAVDDLLKQLGSYLHLGRHVSESGPAIGSFPVDHLDAAFAIDLMRTTLSHLSLMLSAEAERARRNA
ncbi:hypothetical protein [Ferrimicrobium sp.]|uniref:hypothetical protein n=1 Tax=Ferrimicrobium sp. TaxID=2926050 RepID=UPI00260C69DF|nr:hypothetical protein [Ferrimicrobium sp.]